MRRPRAWGAAILVGLALAGCGAAPTTKVPAVAPSASWAEPGPPSITLMTAVNRRSGAGGHAALLISGSQRVIFDPAGSWRHPTVPERGDVLYAITPTMLDFYTDYHARPTYDLVLQRLEVAPETAERALALAAAHGPAARATCGVSVSGILRELGFAEVGRSWFPERIMRDFDRIPGVARRTVADDTVDAHSPGSQRAVAIRDDRVVALTGG
jgi:hypothetical protein